MWHEKWVPTTISDVAWSRQKVTELQQLLASCRNGTQLRALLMYGPSGCGKVSAFHALFPDVSVKVHYAVEGTIEGLQTFFQDFFHCVSHPLKTKTSPTSQSSPSSDFSVFIVKELPIVFGTVRRQNLNSLLLRTLEAIRGVGTRSRAGQSDPASPRALLVFVHTVHDTHSDKVNLMETYPRLFLSHSVMSTFHCTAITVRSMMARLTTVCKRQAIPVLPHGGTGSSDEVTENVLKLISESSRGDIRQALLQLEWLCLLQVRKNGTAECSPLLQDAGRTKSSKGKSKKQSSSFLDLCDEGATATESVAGAASESVGEAQLQIASRDEYVDVAHAAARLLTQKYGAADVLNAVNTPVWKIMGYVTNNMHMYFDDKQIEELGDCLELASELDHATSLFEPSSLASTAPGERVATVAFHCFGTGYKHYHKEVHTPKVFVSLSPPKFSNAHFPKFLAISSYQSENERFSKDFAELDSLSLDPNAVAKNDRRQFQWRLEQSSSPALDMAQDLGYVRAEIGGPCAATGCSSAVAMDVAPMMWRILCAPEPPAAPAALSLSTQSGFNQVSSAPTITSTDKKTIHPFFSSARNIATKAPASKPKRTMFQVPTTQPSLLRPSSGASTTQCSTVQLGKATRRVSQLQLLIASHYYRTYVVPKTASATSAAASRSSFPTSTRKIDIFADPLEDKSGASKPPQMSLSCLVNDVSCFGHSLKLRQDEFTARTEEEEEQLAAAEEGGGWWMSSGFGGDGGAGVETRREAILSYDPIEEC